MTFPARGGPDTAGMREAPDPRFRDQLAGEAGGHGLAIAVDQRVVLCTCGWRDESDDNLTRPVRNWSLHVADSLLLLVEAQVQAAANQRAAEVRRALAWAWLGHEPHTRDWDGPRSDEALEWADGMLAHPALAAALASPAPAPHAEAGPTT